MEQKLFSNLEDYCASLDSRLHTLENDVEHVLHNLSLIQDEILALSKVVHSLQVPAPAPVPQPDLMPLDIVSEEDPTPAGFAKSEPLQTPPVPAPAPQPQPQPQGGVIDLHRAISIGDSFLFKREFFKGDVESYQRTIDVLNKMRSLQEALNYIRSQFHWKEDTVTFETFLGALKRRFPRS